MAFDLAQRYLVASLKFASGATQLFIKPYYCHKTFDTVTATYTELT